jgi:Fe-S-cluster-containing dehydrogenase component
MENAVPLGKFRLRVHTPQNSIVHNKPPGEFPNIQNIHWLPVPCQHCIEAPCIKACPTRAMQKRRKDGVVIIDQDKCIGVSGCRSCFDACPYDALFFNEETGIMEKCTLCKHRIDKGKVPLCVIVCPTRAIHYGDVNDVNSDVHKLLKSRDNKVLQTEHKNRPSVFYLI